MHLPAPRHRIPSKQAWAAVEDADVATRRSATTGIHLVGQVSAGQNGDVARQRAMSFPEFPLAAWNADIGNAKFDFQLPAPSDGMEVDAEGTGGATSSASAPSSGKGQGSTAAGAGGVMILPSTKAFVPPSPPKAMA